MLFWDFNGFHMSSENVQFIIAKNGFIHRCCKRCLGWHFFWGDALFNDD